MKHSELTELMHAVLDGEASAAEARELERLLAADPAARAEFDELERLFEALHSVPQQYPPEGLVAAVDGGAAAARRRHAVSRQPLARSRVVRHRVGPGRHPGRRRNKATGTRSEPPTRSNFMSQQHSGLFAKRKAWIGAAHRARPPSSRSRSTGSTSRLAART